MAKTHRNLYLLLTFVVLLGAAALFIWYLVWGQYEESTQDAYVEGNIVEITAQISGITSSVHVDNTNFVEEGQLLVSLDKTDPRLAFEKSKANLGKVVRHVAQLFEMASSFKGEYEVRKAQLVRAQQDYENRLRLVGLGAVSKEEFEHVTAAFKEALGNYDASKASYLGAYDLVRNSTIPTHPLVEEAKQLVKENFVALRRTEILAPATGLIAQKKVQVGQSITKEDFLLSIIPLNQIWVDANFKEIHLKNIRIGQPVRVTCDMYGNDLVYQGLVVGIAGGTGSAFSLLPPQNATGNWIKIVQRVPVRIALNPDQVKKYPLRLGLSMRVKVDTHDRKGKVVSPKSTLPALYSTDIYQSQISGVEGVIEQILQKNLPSTKKSVVKPENGSCY